MRAPSSLFALGPRSYFFPSRHNQFRRPQASQPASFLKNRLKRLKMLVYLFLVFSCGWCACWLLFLSYQQQQRQTSDDLFCEPMCVEQAAHEGCLEELEEAAEGVEGPAELVVDSRGGHLLVSGEAARCIKFCAGGGGGSSECVQCAAPLLRGWPSDLTCEWLEEEEEESECELVPVLGLLENPLAHLHHSQDVLHQRELPSAALRAPVSSRK